MFNRILDNLPVAVAFKAEENGRSVKFYERGFYVGTEQVDKVCLSAAETVA